MIVDFHTHTFPDKIASEAMSKLKDLSSFNSFSDGTEKSLERELKKGPVSHAVILPISTKQEQVKSINRYNASKNNKNLFFLGTMHPEFRDFENELNFLKNKDIHGIKLHPEFQSFEPDNKALFPIYETLISKDMFVIFHSGKEEFLKRKTPLGHPASFAKLHKIFPKLKMVIAHFGAHALPLETKKHLLGQDIFIDLSFEFPFLSSAFIKHFFKKHSCDHLLFGSDSPWQPIQKYYSFFDKLKLSVGVKEKITSINALRLLKKE